MHPYERWIIRRYLANALRSSRFARPPPADRNIVSLDREPLRVRWACLSAPQNAPVETMGDNRLADAGRALEGVARSRRSAWLARRRQILRLFKSVSIGSRGRVRSPTVRAGSSASWREQRKRPRSALLSRRSTIASVFPPKAQTVLTCIPSWRRAPSGANSSLEGDFPNWV